MFTVGGVLKSHEMQPQSSWNSIKAARMHLKHDWATFLKPRPYSSQFNGAEATRCAEGIKHLLLVPVVRPLFTNEQLLVGPNHEDVFTQLLHLLSI